MASHLQHAGACSPSGSRPDADRARPTGGRPLVRREMHARDVRNHRKPTGTARVTRTTENAEPRGPDDTVSPETRAGHSEPSKNAEGALALGPGCRSWVHAQRKTVHGGSRTRAFDRGTMNAPWCPAVTEGHCHSRTQRSSLKQSWAELAKHQITCSIVSCTQMFRTCETNPML